MSSLITPRLRDKDPVFPSVVAGVYFLPKETASLRLKRFIRVFQPLAEKTPAGNKLRRETFHICDGNGSGYCSLADVDNFVCTQLNKEYGHNEGDELFRKFRPSYIRAFDAARVIADKRPKYTDLDDDDYVTYSEFRILNAYLCIYASIFHAFCKIDGSNNKSLSFDVDDDRRISKEEWLRSYELVQNTGFAGLAKIQSDSLATIAFDTMDADHQGVVLFQEFCEYVKKTEMDSRTDLGKLLSGSVTPIAPKASPNKINTARSALPAGASTSAKPIAVSDAYYTGQSCSQDLMDFLRVFAPLAEKSTLGKKDRQNKFSYADPNGSGYASLAELENYIKHGLTGAFPRNRARDLFIRFRKSYIKAFQRAKSLHDEGGNDAVSEQYVSFAEFRLFNAYLCVYAALLDSFSRINESSDRIDYDEFMQRYNYVRDYGFLVLDSFESADDATAFFNALDVDGSNQVSYQEWCDLIIKFEIDTQTDLGMLMKLSLE